MKKTFLTVLFFFAFAITTGLCAQEDDFTAPVILKNESETRPFFIFSEGVTTSWLTRIIKQTERSNFVFRDFLPGLYFRTELHNIKYVTPMVRLAAYYPAVSSFNNYPQKPRTPLHFGVDMSAGLRFGLFDFDYLRLNAGPALHMFFLNADRWNYFNMGAAGFLEFQVPLAERWTIFVNGIASLDNGNLGGNRLMEPFDIAWQYQVDIGVRYSKKWINGTYLIRRKPKEANNIEVFYEED